MNIIPRLKAIYGKLIIRFQLIGASTDAQKKAWKATPDYQEYIDKQLERTLIKKDNKGFNTYILIDQIAKFIDFSDCDVLCVGSRNFVEIEHFHNKGAHNVTAIDLYSQHPDIMIMDMHQMTFARDSFDIVFSSHSLEHAYDATQVINEFLRICRPGGLIAIEIPVNFKPSEADRVDFGDLDRLHSAFSPYIDQILWSDLQFPETPQNNHKVSIVRTIMATSK